MLEAANALVQPLVTLGSLELKVETTKLFRLVIRRLQRSVHSRITAEEEANTTRRNRLNTLFQAGMQDCESPYMAADFIMKDLLLPMIFEVQRKHLLEVQATDPGSEAHIVAAWRLKNERAATLSAMRTADKALHVLSDLDSPEVEHMLVKPAKFCFTFGFHVLRVDNFNCRVEQLKHYHLSFWPYVTVWFQTDMLGFLSSNVDKLKVVRYQKVAVLQSGVGAPKENVLIKAGHTRSCFALAAYKKKDVVFVCGGYRNREQTKTVLRFSLDDRKFHDVPDMIYERSEFSATVTGDRLFVFGGRYTAIQQIEMLRVSSGMHEWQLIQPQDFTRRDHVCTIALSDNKILIMGGKTNADYLSNVLMLAIDCRNKVTIKKLFDLPFGLRAFQNQVQVE